MYLFATIIHKLYKSDKTILHKFTIETKYRRLYGIDELWLIIMISGSLMAYGGGPFNNSYLSQLIKVLLLIICRQMLNNCEYYNTINDNINII